MRNPFLAKHVNSSMLIEDLWRLPPVLNNAV